MSGTKWTHERTFAYGRQDRTRGRHGGRGLSRKRLRYSISGAAGFSIHERRGRIAYDGTAINGQQAILNVTATDKRGKAESASLGITISVTQPTPEIRDTVEPLVKPLVAPVVAGVGQALETMAQVIHRGNLSVNGHPWQL